MHCHLTSITRKRGMQGPSRAVYGVVDSWEKSRSSLGPGLRSLRGFRPGASGMPHSVAEKNTGHWNLRISYGNGVGYARKKITSARTRAGQALFTASTTPQDTALGY